MGRVYILFLNTGKYYVGSTSNLQQRIAEHQSGKSPYTRGKGPVLHFSKEYSSLLEAQKMEYRLKKMKSKRIIENYIHGDFE